MLTPPVAACSWDCSCSPPEARPCRASGPPGPTTLPRPPAALRAGLDREEVLALLGPPLRRSRQIFAHRAREQWLYGPPRNLRLVFDCPQRTEAPPPSAASPPRP